MNEISSKRTFENKSYQPNIKTKPPILVMRKEGFYQVPGAGLEPARLIQPTDFKSVMSTNSITRAIII